MMGSNCTLPNFWKEAEYTGIILFQTIKEVYIILIRRSVRAPVLKLTSMTSHVPPFSSLASWPLRGARFRLRLFRHGAACVCRLTSLFSLILLYSLIKSSPRNTDSSQRYIASRGKQSLIRLSTSDFLFLLGFLQDSHSSLKRQRGGDE